MPKSTQQPTATPQTPVPHAPGLTYSALCRTRRMEGIPIAKGTLLARDGAWQNKAVVAYVVYAGTRVSPHGHEYHIFIVGQQPLGRFYADGRMVPAKAQAVREVEISTTDGLTSLHNLGGWCPVEPFGQQPEQMLLGGKQHKGNGKSYIYGHQLVADGGPNPELLWQAAQAKSAAAKAAYKAKHSAAPPPPPEAVLAQFQIN